MPEHKWKQMQKETDGRHHRKGTDTPFSVQSPSERLKSVWTEKVRVSQALETTAWIDISLTVSSRRTHLTCAGNIYPPHKKTHHLLEQKKTSISCIKLESKWKTCDKCWAVMYGTYHGHQRTRPYRPQAYVWYIHRPRVLGTCIENDVPSAFQVNIPFHYILSALCAPFIVFSEALQLLQIPGTRLPTLPPGLRSNLESNFSPLGSHTIRDAPRSGKIWGFNAVYHIHRGCSGVRCGHFCSPYSPAPKSQ